MQRQKTEEEIRQELLDEEFARNLQEEMNRSEVPRGEQAYPANQERMAHVLCPQCHATNNVPTANAYQSFRCGSCNNILPAQVPPRGVSVITCQNCRCHNEIPVGATTQFMCGRCFRVLSFNQPQVQPPAQVHQAQSAGPPQSQEAIYEGRVTKTIQVKCGQCQTINSVKASKGVIEFTCQNCHATNEVDA
jgi:phage FluMu protein Com